jgi:methanethiol S-methyltransferase
MEKQPYFVLVIICLITHIIRSIYEVLKHRKTIKAGKLSFVIMFINMVILWLSWFALCGIDIYTIPLSPVIKYTGIIIVGLGVILFLAGLFTIKTLETYNGELITQGIYSKIRHPMYAGFILWLSGMPFFYGAIFSFFLSFFLIANVFFWRFLEEKELEKRFPAYMNYKNKTLF